MTSEERIPNDQSRAAKPTDLGHSTFGILSSLVIGGAIVILLPSPPDTKPRKIRPPMAYNFTAIEKKWQRYWLENKTFRALDPQDAGSMPKAYILDMFPYPSGAGLHVGHPEGYTATDIVSRY